jgi:hypothetical protein
MKNKGKLESFFLLLLSFVAFPKMWNEEMSGQMCIPTQKNLKMRLLKICKGMESDFTSLSGDHALF